MRGSVRTSRVETLGRRRVHKQGSACPGSKQRAHSKQACEHAPGAAPASFSMCWRYSASVVAPMVRSSPRASIGFSRLAARGGGGIHARM